MNTIIQPTLSSCGPTAILNLGLKLGIKLNFKSLKKDCRTDKDGTFHKDLLKTVSNYFIFKEKKYKNFSSLKKDLYNNYIILGYDYNLKNGETEGHYALISLSNNNKIIAHNFYKRKDADQINYKNKNVFFRKQCILTEQEFREYQNIIGILVKKDNRLL